MALGCTGHTKARLHDSNSSDECNADETLQEHKRLEDARK